VLLSSFVSRTAMIAVARSAERAYAHDAGWRSANRSRQRRNSLRSKRQLENIGAQQEE